MDPAAGRGLVAGQASRLPIKLKIESSQHDGFRDRHTRSFATMSAEIKTMPVPLLDLVRQYRAIREPLLEAVTRVIESQRFILGPEVERFEKRFAAYCGTRHGIGCASGTDALELALLALNIGPGDEVLTVPYTFFATGGAILSAGATPVFIDVAADTFNLDTDQLETALARHPQVKAILPVHLFGACANMQPIPCASKTEC